MAANCPSHEDFSLPMTSDEVTAMTSRFLILALTILVTGSAAAAELRVPAGTAYLAPNANGAQVSLKRGITGWRDPKLKVLWFGEVKETGKLTAAVALRVPKDATSTLRLTVAGQAHETTATGADQLVTVKFGEVNIAKPGYQSF